MSELFWRAMRREDLPAVHELAKRVHAAYPERPEIAEERLALAPEWCRVLEGEGCVRGYLVAHPAKLHAPPPLDTLLGRLPEEAGTLYLHDLVIDPDWRRGGRAVALVAQVEAEACAMFGSLSLVSIAGVARFWERLGFEAHECTELEEVLRSYDPQARYMVKLLRA
jgi:GNAT superfamily N-acetyltransferase